MIPRNIDEVVLDCAHSHARSKRSWTHNTRAVHHLRLDQPPIGACFSAHPLAECGLSHWPTLGPLPQRSCTCFCDLMWSRKTFLRVPNVLPRKLQCSWGPSAAMW